MPEGAATERDALDRWFDMQRVRWWSTWRWAVWLAWVVLIGSILTGDYGFGTGHYQSHYGRYYGYASQPLYELVSDALQSPKGLLLLGSIALLWLAATQLVRSFALPEDLALTTGPREIYRRTLGRARRDLYRILGWHLALVLLFLEAGLRGSLIADSPVELWVVTISSAGMFCFTVEWLIALLLRFPPRLGNNSLYCLPFVHIPVTLTFDWVSRYTPVHNTTLFNDFGYLTSVVVSFGLLGGMALGSWLWRYLLNHTTAAGQVIMAALLTSITHVRAGIETSRGGTQLFAWFYASAIHGTALGNPLAGWTSGGLSTRVVSPSSFMYSFGHPEYEYGMYLLPELFMPVWATLLWFVLYYGFSVWAIRSAANVMPRGYTGTWQR